MHELIATSGFEADLLARVCAKAPYNRLHQLEPWGVQGVSAWVHFESEPGQERGPYASAEIGRHLAILGSCALARQKTNSALHYYLARRARLERTALSFVQPEPCQIVAEAITKDTARTTLYAGTDVIATLECSYQVLSERLFARLFREHYVASLPDVAASPYARPLALTCEFTADTATGHLGTVTPDLCPGHFAHYPALPVAILMDGLHRLACAHLALLEPRPFRLKQCDVQADRLAFSGTKVTFRARQLHRTEAEVTYTCRAEAADESQVYGQAEMTYAITGTVPPESGLRGSRR